MQTLVLTPSNVFVLKLLKACFFDAALPRYYTVVFSIAPHGIVIYHCVKLLVVHWTSNVMSVTYRLIYTYLSSHLFFVWGTWHKPFIMKSIQDCLCSGRCLCCIHDRVLSLCYASVLHCMIIGYYIYSAPKEKSKTFEIFQIT